MNPKVDSFIERADKWQKEFEKLRDIVLSSGLQEEFKWGNPCYTSNGKNIVLIHGFKEYCALLFFKGALLSDSHQMLIQQTENVQAARQIRFTNEREIIKSAKAIKFYINQAIEIEKAGLKVPLKKSTEYKVPEEFRVKLKENNELKKAFYALTPGRQRAYLLHFSSPAQAKTRESRVAKSIKQILRGKGLND